MYRYVLLALALTLSADEELSVELSVVSFFHSSFLIPK